MNDQPFYKPPAVVRSVDDIEQLTGQIKAALMESDEAIRRGMNFARQVGAMLTRAKAKIAHGQFEPWVERHFKISPRQARNYMRYAEEFDSIPEAERLTLKGAMKYLTDQNESNRNPGSDLGEKPIENDKKGEGKGKGKGKKDDKPSVQPTLELDPAERREKDAKEMLKAWKESVEEMLEGLPELLQSPAAFDLKDEARRVDLPLQAFKKESYNVHAGIGSMPTTTVVESWPILERLAALFERLSTMNYTRT